MMLVRRWRQHLWEKIGCRNILEVGVGTGQNIPHYSEDLKVTAVDSNPNALKIASERAERHDVDVRLIYGDISEVDFEQNHYDAAVSTFVLCQLSNPHTALQNILGALKPGAALYMLEQTTSTDPAARILTSLCRPLYWATGSKIPQDLTDQVSSAGFAIVEKYPVFARGAVVVVSAQKPFE